TPALICTQVPSRVGQGASPAGLRTRRCSRLGPHDGFSWFHGSPEAPAGELCRSANEYNLSVRCRYGRLPLDVVAGRRSAPSAEAGLRFALITTTTTNNKGGLPCARI